MTPSYLFTLTSVSRPFLAVGAVGLLEVSTTDDTTSFVLPNGLNLTNPNGYNTSYFRGITGYMMMAAYGTGDPSETVAFQDNDRLMWPMTILRVPRDMTGVWPEFPVSATECTLSYCVNDYNSEVRNGTLYERVTSAPSERSAQSWQPYHLNSSHFDPNNPSRLEFSNIYSAVLRTDLQIENGFNVSKLAVDGLSYFFQKTFTEAYSLKDRPNGTGALGNMYYPS